MKPRKIWIRKKKEKGKLSSYIVEGQTTKKKELIWTISHDLIGLLNHLIKTSFFTKEKSEKIQSKLDSLEIKPQKETKPSPEVRSLNIRRTPKNDYKPTTKELWEMTE